MAKKKAIKEEKPIDMSDDNDIEARYENGGDCQCENCCETFYITEGYSDEFCSKKCHDEMSGE